MADFTAASVEQSAGIEQINRALTQMDNVIQQNSALVEENAATAKTLEHQAKAMDERIAFFRIGNVANVQDAPRAKVSSEKTAPKPSDTDMDQCLICVGRCDYAASTRYPWTCS